jgi:HSP20 family protein
MNTTVDTPRTERREAAERIDYLCPCVNISSSKDDYLLEVEMPGVSKDGLEVTVEGNELTIIGRRRREKPGGEAVYCETCPEDYRRVFEIASDIDISKINAQMDQGILKLRLPKSERVKPHKIQISE